MTARQRWVAMVAAGLVATGLLAGCGAGVDDSDEGSAQAPARMGSADQAGNGAERDDDGGQAGGLFDTRSIIYIGEITVRVDDVDEATERATALANRYGGFVGADRRTVGDEHSIATMTLRIPSENFTAAVNGLGELGKEQAREIETEDVTEEMIDLEARIATAQASVDRTRALLEQADSITEIVAVEEELSTREATLGRLQARQRTLADLTTLSTITVRLLGPEAESEPAPASEAGFLVGLGAGWSAFTTSTTYLITVLGAMLPFLVAIGAPVTAAVWWARRRRAQRPA